MRRTLAVALFLSIAPTAAMAQAQTGPRAGSWGAETGLQGASLLRFRSPSAAWLLGFEAFYQQQRTEDTGTFPSSDTDEAGFVAARFGFRRYHNVDRRVRPFTTLGASASAGTSSTNFWALGAFGEIGATFFFSPHVGLGASSELIASYTRRTAATVKGTGYFIRLTGPRLLGSVYF